MNEHDHDHEHEHEHESDQHAHPVGPEIDDSVNPTQASPDEDAQRPKATAGREMLIQLQQMIDTVALQAAPVVREVAAKAAELAAVAAERAGPVAHKAADVTESVSERIAARSKEVAADLRRPRDETVDGGEEPSEADSVEAEETESTGQN